jgi:arabinosaccharide transport system substrate-binding protein
MQFPYGKAPLFIGLVAIVSGLGVLWSHSRYGRTRPDLVMMTHARLHADIYRAKIPEFEKRHGVRVEVQEMELNAMRARLQAAFATGTEVPDVVEMPDNAAYFLRGPTKDVGLLDLTSWVAEDKLKERMVDNRFSLWERRGRIYGLPHDVHPVMLAYRADIVEGELGIDVSKIQTWDDFVAMAQKIGRDLNGDGVQDRYALELYSIGGDQLSILLLQRGISLFDAEGRVAFDREETVDVIVWYIHQLFGPQRIAYDLGSSNSQPLWRAMMDGLVLFYFTPDWRTRTIQEYAPAVSGKIKLMPLPAWTPGGRRTSTWGSTGIGITRGTRNPELAKKFVEFLYIEQTDAGKSALDLHIVPPVREAWNLPLLNQPSPFYCNQPIMRLYAELAGDVPQNYATPYSPKAETKRNAAFIASANYFRANGDKGLREFVRAELKRQADAVREQMARNLLMGL